MKVKKNCKILSPIFGVPKLEQKCLIFTSYLRPVSLTTNGLTLNVAVCANFGIFFSLKKKM